jgi:hypothetical protein
VANPLVRRADQVNSLAKDAIEPIDRTALQRANAARRVRRVAVRRDPPATRLVGATARVTREGGEVTHHDRRRTIVIPKTAHAATTEIDQRAAAPVSAGDVRQVIVPTAIERPTHAIRAIDLPTEIDPLMETDLLVIDPPMETAAVALAVRTATDLVPAAPPMETAPAATTSEDQILVHRVSVPPTATARAPTDPSMETAPAETTSEDHRRARRVNVPCTAIGHVVTTSEVRLHARRASVPLTETDPAVTTSEVLLHAHRVNVPLTEIGPAVTTSEVLLHAHRANAPLTEIDPAVTTSEVLRHARRVNALSTVIARVVTIATRRRALLETTHALPDRATIEIARRTAIVHVTTKDLPRRDPTPTDPLGLVRATTRDEATTVIAPRTRRNDQYVS